MKLKIALFASTLLTSPVLAEQIHTTPHPDKVKQGQVIQVQASQVPNYCNFRFQIVRIGHDKHSNTVMACLKR